MEPTLPKPPTNDQPNPPAVEKPKKEKKPPTEAQQAARQKGLAAMMEKRKQMSEEVKVKREKVKVAKKAVEDKILKNDVGFVMKDDFESRISSLTKELGELRGIMSMKQQVEKEKPAAAKPAERIVERVIERPAVSVTPTPAKLTGHALLDKIFFDK